MKTVAFHTLGCKVNTYESNAMLKIFNEAGYQEVDFKQVADVYVINTCTVTNTGDSKSRQMIRKAIRKNPKATICVVGCYSQTAPEEIEKIEGVGVVLGTQYRSDIVKYVDEHLETGEMVIKVDNVMNLRKFEDLNIDRFKNTRAFLKIQDGCNRFCTYCTIPYARGSVCSKDPNKVLEEVKELAAHGFKEVILSGIHTASYGLDLEGNINLINIIEEIEKIDGIERIRIGSIEPAFFTEEVVEKIKGFKKLCPHFHLSLQSGCDATLKRMNRRYTAEEYEASVNMLRETLPDVSISTDVIVGFPGETEEEFNETYEYLKRIHLTKTHVFKYSPRKGTKAADMPNQLDGTVKDIRSKALIELNDKNEHAFTEKFIGRVMDVLIEKEIKDKPDFYEGYTRNYIKVIVHCMSADITGKIVDVKIEEAVEDYAIASMV